MLASVYNCVHFYYMTKTRHINIFDNDLSGTQRVKLGSIYLAKTEHILQALRKRGLLRSRELEAMGISREHLRKLNAQGLVQRVGHGLYGLPDAGITEHRTMAEACKRVPRGVVCLLSALQFHDLTTQLPFEIWLAIDRKAWRPRERSIPLRIVRFSGPALDAGIEEHKIEGVKVRVYNVAKTVADCFKYRNKIGLDVALEALKEGWRERKFTMDELWRYGKICRVANVMRPYLEMLVA
jgi:predicted transcriptional regulator of viral defense system